jgi:purine-binding chemotaxis protein CheW
MAEFESKPQTSAAQQLVVFALQDEEYALPIEAVREVIQYTAPRSVASGDPALCGVINLRGSIVPVYDLRPVLGLGAATDGGGKIVVAALGDTMAGVIVDEVAEVLTVDTANFEELPSTANAAVQGVVRHGERLIVILDPAQVVAPAENDIQVAASAGETEATA